jgi:kynurenine formamidase
MRIIDISGPIYSGMWHYPPPYPEVTIEEIPPPEWLAYPTYSWWFKLCCQSGTYMETSLHVDRDGPPLIDVPVQELFMRPAAVISVSAEPRSRIEVEQIVAGAPKISPGDAVIVDIGWGGKWRDQDFIEASPYFSHDAMYWILDQQPFIFAADTARFDSWEDPQEFFARFFEQGVLLLAPVVDLQQINVQRGHIVALPMKVEEACAAPCRTLFIENWEAGPT